MAKCINSDFVADAARLIGQANSSLKLIGQLKKEIGYYPTKCSRDFKSTYNPLDYYVSLPKFIDKLQINNLNKN